MKETFKQLIINFQQATLPQPLGRELKLPNLPASIRKAFVFVGMRRSGKTWSLYQQMQQLLQNGISKEQIVYINFEDDRLINIKTHDLQFILEAYYELYPQYIDSPNLHFFFDEIHEVAGWEKFIRRLLDTEPMALYLSGSSAKMLSKEIATSLRGRTIVREIFPFNFVEYLRYKNISFPERLSTKQKSLLTYHVKEFLKWGGFPETVNMDGVLHRELLQGYIETVIFRDIIERYQISNVSLIKRLLGHCIQNSAALLSINKLYNSFKSQGFSISKNSLYSFMEYFEDAYCIFSVPLYNFSVRKINLTPKKIYPVDQGLITAYTLKQGYEEASRFETAVFAHLRHKQKEIYYYHTQTGKEVDFLTVSPEGSIELYQSTLTLADENTKQREVLALRHAMSELKVKQSTIVTLDESGEIKTEEGTIRCVPLWSFLRDV